MESDDYLMISGIQHFLFCRRQWALIHVENQWDENGLTAEGQVMHKRVHDASVRDVRNGIVTIRGLRLKSEKYRITGICDAVELLPDERGISFAKLDGTWRVRPVEYKRGKSKIEDCDRMQAVAQALCLEEMLSCEVNQCAIFYGETKRRETFDITEELREKATDVFTEMHKYYETSYTPKVKTTPKCRSCSLKDICLPELLRKPTCKSVKKYIEGHIAEED
ncbi:MAG TPA: CRISPR-associated protein Cas4 [Mogibacterium sp.]|nr:CRISPR-associated protein Cas4 [Mogibacterium sp.]